MSFKDFDLSRIMSCKDYASLVKMALMRQIKELDVDKRPTLCIHQVGNNPASNSYIKGKINDCREVGIEFVHHHYIEEDGTETPFSKVYEAVSEVNANEPYNSIIIQLPLPESYNVEKLLHTIRPDKDVDGFRPDSPFKPCTPTGIMNWMKYNNVPIEGSVATVLGRSDIVGKPMANMLITEGATVISCNSHTPEDTMFDLIKQSDIVISAIGKPNYLSNCFRENQFIIDVGINRDKKGKLCGDVDRKAVEELTSHKTYVTPVPGGVGLLTRVALLQNTYSAFLLQNQD